jgi:hypothetical protein
MVYYGTMENWVGGWSGGVEVRSRSPLYCFQQISCGQWWIYGITKLSIRNVIVCCYVCVCVCVCVVCVCVWCVWCGVRVCVWCVRA